MIKLKDIKLFKKKILYSEDARIALQQGMNILAKAVGVTLGPKGKNVVLDSELGIPQIVNDGITIAKEIKLENSFQNTGVALIRQSTSKTNTVAGDGTTTATVLAHAIVQEGIKHIYAGYNPIFMKMGIEKSVHFLVNKIAEYARPIDNINDIINIASISAGNNFTIGNLIAEAIKKVGREGIITLEEGESTQTSLDFTLGMEFDKGFISPYFAKNETENQIVQDNPLILLTDKKITLIQEELIPLLEQVSTLNRSLLIIAEDIEKDVLATLIMNKLKGIINVVAVRAPGFGDSKKSFLEDIAILTGATVISADVGLTLSKLDFNMMGSAQCILVSKNKTKIVTEKNKQAVKLRCNQLKKQLQASNNSYEKEKLRNRLSKLSGTVAVIKIGASTEAEMKEKKLRFEDAINATKSAIEEGILPGGGAALLHLSLELNIWAKTFLSSEELVGAKILVKALSVPLATIVNNSGFNSNIIIDKVQKNDFAMGYDANKNRIVNMYSAGVIDPAKVTRSVIQNASSISSMILTTECLISNQNFEIISS